MTIAEETRAAVRREPFLVDALRAGVVNYTAAARYLDVDAGEEAVAAALRRYAGELSERAALESDARVTMQSRLGPVDEPTEALLIVGDAALAPGEGSLTGVLARSSADAFDPRALGTVLARCDAEDVDVEAAGAAGDSLLVVVDRRDGPAALQVVEDVLQ